ncbi:MAG TPA: hypothetical protein VFK57_18870 [Vicinamibacterales bacterium]|nr:hypothetical protein [Vicinamibacterales bacterium]
MKRLLAAAALAVVAACGGTTAPTPPGAGGTYSSPHFTFNYTALDAGNIAATAAALEREYDRIVADLRAGSMPPVTVTFYGDHGAMEAATRAAAGAVPAWAAGLITSATQIHLMSPNLPSWGPYERMLSHLVHEFAHCVSMKVNPRIANNPRWLWESVAIYEAGQAVDLSRLDYMRASNPPSFESLAGLEQTRMYDVGYSIAEFIVARWGAGALADLIVAGGDTAGVLGIGLADFEREWFAFARQRYNF